MSEEQESCPSCGWSLTTEAGDRCPACDAVLPQTVEAVAPEQPGAHESLRKWLLEAEGAGAALYRAGVLALFLFVIGNLFLVHLPVSPTAHFVFLAPPVMALAAVRKKQAHWSVRLLGMSHLVLLAAGTVVARDPRLLPGMNAWKGELPPLPGRILTWYTGVYLFYAWWVLPPYFFGRCLWRRARGRATVLSPPVCYLGLFTWGLFMLGLSAGLPQLYRWLMTP